MSKIYVINNTYCIEASNADEAKNTFFDPECSFSEGLDRDSVTVVEFEKEEFSKAVHEFAETLSRNYNSPMIVYPDSDSRAVIMTDWIGEEACSDGESFIRFENDLAYEAYTLYIEWKGTGTPHIKIIPILFDGVYNKEKLFESVSDKIDETINYLFENPICVPYNDEDDDEYYDDTDFDDDCEDHYGEYEDKDDYDYEPDGDDYLDELHKELDYDDDPDGDDYLEDEE